MTSSAADRSKIWPDAIPPVAERQATTRIVHGTELEDDYAWLRAENWRDVLADPSVLPAPIRTALDAENRYADAHLDRYGDLVERLVAEMRGRMKEDDASVPLEDGAWLYYRRFREGGQRPLFCRKRGEAGDEHILVDGDHEGEGQSFFSIDEVVHAPDHARLAWSFDAKGSELYEIRVRDCASLQDAGDRVMRTSGAIVWLQDSSGFLYVKVDENHRTCQVYRHILGQAEDTLVLEENDPAWFVSLDRTTSGAYALITVSDHNATEGYLLDLGIAEAVPRCIAPRAPELRYSVTHCGDTLFIRTNADGAEDFKIVTAPVETPGRGHWTDLVPHRRGCIVTGLAVFPDHLVRLEREEGLPRIVVRDLTSGEEHAIAFTEEAYSLTLEPRLTFATDTLRFTYASMTTPRETYDYDLHTRERRLRKRQAIPSGHDPAAYATRRLFAEADDGERVPLTVLHRTDLRRNGEAPLLLYGYGAYGHALPATFNANILSLVDRGFVYAIAHVRGGTDKGWHWYTDGKLEKKTNTFSDFIAAARTLVGEGYTGERRIVAQGGSAGGMLMGAIANMAPSLFAGIIANVPFVDVLNTILDASLPLTPPEWLEWGDPINDPAVFERIRAYSPYDNVTAQAYPPLLVLAGLTDPRVTYWEPAKWVARLRATMTGGGPVLLKTNMGAGHGGASGRFEYLTEIARQYAFAIACAGQVSMKDFSSAIDANR